MLILRDTNAHSPIWNPHYQRRKNSGLLEELIERYELIVNNDPKYSTRPASQGGVSIIDLALSSPELGPLCLWQIPEEYPSLSGHELILLGWDAIEEQSQPYSPKKSPTGWSIQKLLEDDTLFQQVKTAWIECSAGKPYSLGTSLKIDLDDEVEWFESTLSSFLDKHAKILRVSSFSKRCWNKEVAEARKIWARAKKTYQGKLEFKDELRQV